MGVFAGPTNSWINLNSSNSLNGLVRNGLVLALDAGRTLSYPGSGYWSGSYGTAANAFDGNLNTFSGGAGGTFSATYTFNNGLDVSGTVRVYVTFGATSGQVNGRTGVILVDGNDISSKMAAANLTPSPGWVDVTSEVGSIFNTVVLNGTGGSTNPSIAAIEVNGQILVGTTWAGTTWTDLSGSGNNGTLTNGPTYSSANGGSLVFDGVDDYVNLGSSIQNYSTFTTSFWVYYNSYDQRESPLGNASQPSGYHFLFLFGSIYVGFSSGYTGDPFIGVSLHPYKANPYIPTDPGDFYYNTWNNFVVTKDSNNDVLFYRNAVSLGGGNKPGVTNIDKIGLGLYFNDMRFPQLLFYNRALTATEVSQNFNATRSRFSI